MIKQRNIVVAIILSVVTLGIYGIYWMVSLSNDIVKASKGKHFTTNGIVAFLLGMVTFGIYTFYWMFKLGQSVSTIKGDENGSDSVIYLILTFLGFSPVALILAQVEVNKVAEA